MIHDSYTFMALFYQQMKFQGYKFLVLLFSHCFFYIYTLTCIYFLTLTCIYRTAFNPPSIIGAFVTKLNCERIP